MAISEAPKGHDGEPSPIVPYKFQSRTEYIDALTVTRSTSFFDDKEYDEVVVHSVDRSKGEYPSSRINSLSHWTRINLNSRVNRAVNEFVDRHWWLQTAWQERLEKGLLKEQFVMGINDKKISLYNLGPLLSDEQLTHFQSSVDYAARFDPSIFDGPLWLGVHTDPIGEPDPKDEGTTAAMSYYKRRFIELNQAGTTGVAKGDMREKLNGRPIFPLVLTHEFGHFIARNGHVSKYPYNEDPWIKATGWEYSRDARKWILPNGIAPSKYCFAGPDEDFPDSLSFYFHKPSDLDEARHRYLSENDQKAEAPTITLERKVGSQITLPFARTAKIAYRLS